MAKPPRDEPPQPTYFLDENTRGPAMCERLRAAGLIVEDIKDHFRPKDGRPSVLDTEWIPEVAARGWWAVTRDVAILGTERELGAHLRAEGVLLVIRGKKLTINAMADAIIKAHNRLRVMVPKRRRPMVIYVFHDGRVEVRDGGARRGGPKGDRSP